MINDGIFLSGVDINSPEVKTLFTNDQVSKKFVANMLPQLSKALKIPHLTNGQVRPSSIRRMKKGGAGWEDIMKVSKHKSVNSVKSYNPDATLQERLAMAFSINARDPNRRITRSALATAASGALQKPDQVSIPIVEKP
jgi:hypothetical protein